MKVKELIKILKKCNPEYEVRTEGCDCYGDVEFVNDKYLENEVFLGRKDGDISNNKDNLK